MDWMQVVVLAVLQGVTEFLPISSSAHLILVSPLLGWPDQGLAFDVALHVGSLVAIVHYLRAEILGIACGWWRHLRGGGASANSRLGWAIIIATIPVGIAGLLLNSWVAHGLRQPMVIAAATAFFALVLWLADRMPAGRHDEHELNWRDTVIIGFAQALALIPGTSRSGITMTAGRAVGLSREAASRFSFLLAIPVIALAGAHDVYHVVRESGPASWGAMTAGALISAVTAWWTVHFFLKLVERVGMTPFVIYRLLLAAILFQVFY